jgi:hypothetical protein
MTRRELLDLRLVPAPDGGLAAPDRPDRSLAAAELAELIGPGRDVRLLTALDVQNLPTLARLADLLDRDVLVAPPGSRLTRDHDELVAVGPGGSPVDWWLIAPHAAIGSVTGWFELTGGRVHRRSGPVVLPLPGAGLALATREDFVRRRLAGAELRLGHEGLATVAVGIEAGMFVVGQYDGRSIHCGGTEVAAVLGRLPLYQADLRAWLGWPDEPDERARLARGLTELAAATGAVVWAPAEGGRAELQAGSGDLTAVGPDGDPTSWQPFGLVGDAEFFSDVDGRLMPVGGPVVLAYPGVALVSVDADREIAMAPRYAEPAVPGVFAVDLAVLADGRLALSYRDGSLLAAGPRQFEQLLLESGWTGEPVAVLADPAPERADRARDHASLLSRALGVPVTLGAGVVTAMGEGLA